MGPDTRIGATHGGIRVAHHDTKTAAKKPAAKKPAAKKPAAKKPAAKKAPAKKK